MFSINNRAIRTKFGNTFYWFEGVVEDVKDPKALGRVKVRILGDHTQDKEKIKTSQLFWCPIIMPINNAVMQGIGDSPVGMVPGTWVFGFYRDGLDKQQPWILGTFGGIPSDPPNPEVGFNDPYEIYPMEDKLNEPDTNRLARGKTGEYPDYDKHDVHIISKAEVQKGMPSCAETWDEPETEREPIYPYNKVWEGVYDPKVNGAKWGHVEEWDSTPMKERYFRWHKTSHNSLEIFPDGREVHKIYGDHFELDLARKMLRVDGDYKITVKGNVDEHICGDKWTYIEGNQITVVDKDIITVSHSKIVDHCDQDHIIKTKMSANVVAAMNLNRCCNGTLNDTGMEVKYLGSAAAQIGVGAIPVADPGDVPPTGGYGYTPYESITLSITEENQSPGGKGGDLYSSIASWSQSMNGTFTDFWKAVPGKTYDVSGEFHVPSHIYTIAIDVATITKSAIVSTPQILASAPFRGCVEGIFLIPTAGSAGAAPQTSDASLSANMMHPTLVYSPVIVDVTPPEPKEQWKDEEPCA